MPENLHIFRIFHILPEIARLPYLFHHFLSVQFLCKVFRIGFPLVLTPGAFLPRAQQPLNVTCHLFMIRPFATPKSNRIRVNKWCENSFTIFFLGPSWGSQRARQPHLAKLVNNEIHFISYDCCNICQYDVLNIKIHSRY